MKILIIASGLLWITTVFAQDTFTPLPGEPGMHEFIYVDQEPLPLNLDEIQRQIPYPAKAFWNKVGGKLYLRILINEQGEYERHKITRSVDASLLVAAEPYIRQLRFSPAIKDNQPVKYWVNVPIVFNPKANTTGTQRLRHPVLFQQTLVHKLMRNHRQAEGLLNRGIDKLDDGEVEAARDLFTRSIRFTPHHQGSYHILILAYYYRAKTHGINGDWKRACTDFTEAIGYLNTVENMTAALEEAGPKIFLGRAMAALAMGEEVRAMNDFCWVERMFPEEVWAGINIFDEWEMTDQDLRACAHILSRMQAVDPKDRLLQTQMKYLETALPAQPRQTSGMLVADASNFPSQHLFEGRTQAAWEQVRSGEIETALATVTTEIEENPHNGDAYLVKAMAMAVIGADDAACEELDQAFTYGLGENGRHKAILLQKRVCH
ncbi:MAG: energy transducer TonB [Bacteroidia bacterium]